MTQPSFGMRLADAMASRGPLCVGIDPHPQLLADWNLPDTAGGAETFAMTVVDALADRVAVLKPQSALFEQYGSAGIAVLEKVLARGAAAGALMLLDAKRGDIGSTMAGYARAYLTDGSPLAADAVTLSPFLGFDSLQPAIDAAVSSGRGIFVLCRTSNPHSERIQLAVDNSSGMTISAAIVDAAAAVNAAATNDAAANDAAPALGPIGLVVGATVTKTGLEPGRDFSSLNGPLLAPGIGAQGATVADLPKIFGAALPAVLPSVSRAILGAGPDKLRDAAEQFLTQMRDAVR